MKSESLGVLAGAIIRDSQKLLSQEAELLAAEATGVWTAVKQDLVFLFWRGLAMVSATLLASLAVAQAINSYTEIPLWSCYGIVAAGFILFTAVLSTLSKNSGRGVRQLRMEKPAGERVTRNA